MNKPVILMAAGGHAKVLLDILQLNQREIIGVCDPAFNISGSKQWRGIPVINEAQLGSDYSAEQIELVNGLGSLPKSFVRRDLFIRYKQLDFNFATLIHPSAVICQSVELGEGVQVMAGAVINADSKIGDNCIINSNATIEHDCNIDQHCHVSPGSTLCGGVNLGMQVHIGAGSTVIQGINVGLHSVVAAGSVLTKSLPGQQLSIGPKAQVFDWI